MNGREHRGVRRWFSVVAPLVLAAAMISTAVRLSADVATTPLRPPASTAGTDLLGRHVSLGSMRGDPLVVIFFASWCGPCHEDAPIFTGLADRYRDQVKFISVAVGDAPRDARAFATRYDWTWPIVPDDQRRWVAAFGPPGVPATFVVDTNGAVIETLAGSVTAGQMDAALDPLVRSSQGSDPTD
jgi:cytochrome c biogenesis protein CcmG, thiol:disulfide interchange protein DsbE